MRGFFVGSLTLIILYAVLQPEAVNAAGTAGGVFTSGLRRLLSPGVAGVPDHQLGVKVGRAITPSTTPAPTSPTSPTIPV